MRLLGLAALLFVGCVPAQAVIEDVDTDDPSNFDTGDDDTGDTANDDTANPDTANPDTANPDTDVEPDLTEWHGSRVFSFANVYGQGPCEETIVEAGVNVTADPDYASALQACAACDELFYVEAGVVRGDNQAPGNRMCLAQTANQGFAIASEIVRGIEFIGDDVKIYTLRQSWSGWAAEQLAEGTLAGTVVSYDYVGSTYGAAYTVDGSIDF